MSHETSETLSQPLALPCGVVLKNRIVKSAMSDSLGDGRGNPTDAQIRLYQRWADGGVAAMIIGEVQGSPDFAEKPGNLVLHSSSEDSLFAELARKLPVTIPSSGSSWDMPVRWRINRSAHPEGQVLSTYRG